MYSVKDLLDILKSQETLYTEMKAVLEAEKECVVTWNSDETVELVKKKNTIASQSSGHPGRSCRRELRRTSADTQEPDSARK